MRKPSKQPPIKSAVIGLCAGGHCRSVLAAIRAMGGIRIIGLLDDSPALQGEAVEGVKVIGPLARLATLQGHLGFFVGLGASDAAGCARRRHLFSLPNGHWRALRVIHPSAVVDRSAAVCPGGQILALAHVGPGAVVGENAVINTLATVEHDAIVGPNAFIGPGAILLGGCFIDCEAFIGAGAVVLPGLKVGFQSTLGAGSVLTRDIPDGETWVGVPAANILPHVPP